jgi:hypothetical protein
MEATTLPARVRLVRELNGSTVAERDTRTARLIQRVVSPGKRVIKLRRRSSLILALENCCPESLPDALLALPGS